MVKDKNKRIVEKAYYDATKRKDLGVYRTYALSENHEKDEHTNATHPSDEQVEEMRDWSIFKKV